LPTEIEENQDKILEYLYAKDVEGKESIHGDDILKATGLKPVQINDAIELLHNSGLVDWLVTFGTAPYNFYSVQITAQGKYEYQRRKEVQFAQTQSEISGLMQLLKRARPPLPIGSPFGFTEADWEIVARKKAKKNVLQVALGCKFDSSSYNTEMLKKNVENMFKAAVQRFNKENRGKTIKLGFVSLHAGYGEHVFNEIARDIISSDIAVFETSDLTPNVFIEVGVALTWGPRVFLIKKKERQRPPSDISGQTYADYLNDAKTFVDPEHEEKLYRMVERAIRKKG